MSDNNAVEGQLASQDTTQLLQRILTGHIVGKSAMGDRPLSATVVKADNTTVTVTVDGFDSTAGQPTPTFICYYEARHHWNGSTNVQAEPPAAGIKCLIGFPPNDPQGYGWALAFQGWPTE